jgi:hypothetical protein
MKGGSRSQNKVPSDPNRPQDYSICQRSVKNTSLYETCSCNLYRLHRWVNVQIQHAGDVTHRRVQSRKGFHCLVLRALEQNGR